MHKHKTDLTVTEKLQLAGMRLGIAFLRRLGFRGVNALGNWLGWLVWYLLPRRRRYASESVKRHLDLNADEAACIARRSFGHNFVSFMEAALANAFNLHDNSALLPVDEHFYMLAHEKRPVVGVTAHIGSWELLAGIIGSIKEGQPQAIVVRNQKNRAANKLIFDMRGSGGGEVVGHRNAAPVVTKILRQNGMVAFLVDHNTLRGEAVFLPFLGEIAAVNVGPAVLALRSKAMIYPLFLIRQGGGMHKIVTRPPLDTASLEGSINERVRQIAWYYTTAVEEIVRAYPEQWFWMHKRWKTKPPHTEGAD